MFITIDPYYSTQFYNESLEALKNNNIEYNEFINIKPPYNWYLDVEKEPIMVNYDIASGSERRWMVNKVEALRTNEEYVLQRRENDNGPKALLKFVLNEPFKEMKSTGYGIFFTIKNREEAEALTKSFPGKVWFMGKYYKNKFRVCFCSNKMIKNWLSPEQILLENNGELNEPGRFEAELNFKIFRGNDMLLKFTETPYFQNGKYNRVNIKPEVSSKFIL